jgi:signal transduction histidine kinase
MSQPAPANSPEREIYHEYERNRRLQLASILLTTLALVQFGVFLVSVVFLLGAQYAPTIRLIFAFNTAVVGVAALLHTLGLRFVRRKQVAQATLSVIVPAGITIMVPLLVWDLFGRTPPGTTSPVMSITLGEMVATLVLIVLAGLLATDRRILVGTTLLMNIFTLFILTTALQIPGVGVALRSEALLLLSFPLLVQWAVAGILLAATGAYLQTLRDLGDVRVAYARAQQLDELKDQFIAHVNHELRSPVMALQGYVELLLLTEETLTPPERHSYLRRAKHAGDDLVALVTNILAVRRLEQDVDDITPERVDIRNVLESAMRLVDPREGGQVERELRLHIPQGLAVWAGSVQVRQILTNLLSNALKYSPPGTPVEVTAELVNDQPAATRRRPWGERAAPEPRQMAEITVRDYGLGIPPDQIPLLFKRFVRLPRDLASNVPGNGLGLYLCQMLAQAMGGSMRVESTDREGEGSAFHLQLPVPLPAHEPALVSE